MKANNFRYFNLYKLSFKNCSNFKKILKMFDNDMNPDSKSLNLIKNSYDKCSYESDIMPSFYKYTVSFPNINNQLYSLCINKKPDFFLPIKTDDNIEKINEITKHLIKIGFTQNESHEMIFLNPKVTEYSSTKIIKNIDFIISFFKEKSVLIEFPKLIIYGEETYSKIFTFFQVYCDLEKNLIDDLIEKNPLLLTCDVLNLHSHLEFLVEIKKEVVELAKKNIDLQEFKKKVDKKDFKKVVSLGEEKMNRQSLLLIEKEMINFSIYQFIKNNPYYLLSSVSNFKESFEIMSSKLGFTNLQTLYLMTKTPDLCFINRNKLLSEKIDLLLKIMKNNKYYVKNFIKAFPHMLLKSFNSYIKKYNYLSDQKVHGKNLTENESIYPLILIYNFEKEIKIKLDILSEIRQFQDYVKLKDKVTSFIKADQDAEKLVLNAKLIEIEKAFSLTPEEFCKETNYSFENYSERLKKISEKAEILNEKDLLFFYSKYTY